MKIINYFIQYTALWLTIVTINYYLKKVANGSLSERGEKKPTTIFEKLRLRQKLS